MNWECPYTEKPTMVESCRNIRASSPPVGMQGDSLSLCRECTKELPGDEETSTCAFSQTDPLEVEEVMESVEKNNGGAQASPVIFSPSAERIAAKSSSHRTRKRRSDTSAFRDLPKRAEWTGTICGHSGKKGVDFYDSDHGRCKKCKIQSGRELRAKQPPKSYPTVPTMTQEGTLKPETMIDAPKPEPLPEVPKTALTIIVPASLTLKLPPLSEILLQVPSGNIKEWILRGLREAEASRGLEKLK